MPAHTRQMTQALFFAAQKHTDQRRKGERGEPYINHLIEVADILAEHAPEQHNVLIAGILHDTVEDTDTSRDDLVRHFGNDIASIVMECTDDKLLPKAERKRLQAETAPHKSDAAKMVKMADKISNLRTMLDSPPAGWDDTRKREYFDWSKTVVAGCRSANESLGRAFDDIYAQGMALLAA